MRMVSAALAALLLSSIANAAPVVRNYAFTAKGFVAGSPYAVVNGNFSISFDNAATLAAPRSTGLSTPTLDVAALNGIGNPQYTYTTNTDYLSVGSKMVNGGCYPYIDTSWCLRITNVSSATPTASFYYIIGAGSSGNMYNTSQVTLSEVAAAVPEIGTWASMLIGFAGIGLMLRGGRREMARG